MSYKPEKIPKELYKDCERCAKTYGTLGCCDTVSNEWVYDCVEGHKEFIDRAIYRLEKEKE